MSGFTIRRFCLIMIPFLIPELKIGKTLLTPNLNSLKYLPYRNNNIKHHKQHIEYISFLINQIQQHNNIPKQPLIQRFNTQSPSFLNRLPNLNLILKSKKLHETLYHRQHKVQHHKIEVILKEHLFHHVDHVFGVDVLGEGGSVLFQEIDVCQAE